MYRIFGPPGTGKTTTLLNMVDKALSDGVAPSSIGFFAFTKKAAAEAKARASRRFELDPDNDLPYFRTLHSLAYRLLGVKEHQMMGYAQYLELSKAIGYDLNGTAYSEEWDTNIKVSDHPVLSLINLARTKKNKLRREYNQSRINFSWTEVDYIANSYLNYKTANNLMDFTDLLMRFNEEAHLILPEFKLCFVDEAQDLSPLQWDIAHALDQKSERMYCAGDDDQAIYVWGGADVNHFIHLPGGSETLEQSYRIPVASTVWQKTSLTVSITASQKPTGPATRWGPYNASMTSANWTCPTVLGSSWRTPITCCIPSRTALNAWATCL